MVVGLSPSSPTPSYTATTPSYTTQSSTTQQTQTSSSMISINPQMTDSHDRPLLEKPTVGTNLNFVTQISNNDNLLTKGYSYIVQVKDENDSVVYINLVNGYVDPANTKTAELSWIPNSPGKYIVEIFVWDKNGVALPLTQKTTYAVEVISK